VPNRIITDNGSQFASGMFQEYCSSVGIKICFASITHLRSNGQAERANAEVLGQEALMPSSKPMARNG
jgi:transposase InsO family protein